MSKPILERPETTLEKSKTWFGIAAIAGGALFGLLVVGLLIAAVVGGPGETDLRGYTWLGILFGVIAAGLGTFAAVYSLRKRHMQERLRTTGSAMMWLWLHVTAGAIALCATFLHAGMGVLSLRLTTGKMLFMAFFTIVASGVIWRLIYSRLPPDAAKTVGNYSQAQSQQRAEDQLTEIEKLVAGRSPELQKLKEWLLAAPRSAEDLRLVPIMLTPADQADVQELARLAASRHRALARGKLQSDYVKKLQGLRLVHIPLTFALPVLLVWHIVGALRLHQRILPSDVRPMGALTGFAASEECKSCHAEIYEEWTGSMHHHAASSPMMIAQNNQLVDAVLSKQKAPDPQEVCVNCHAPLGSKLTDDAKLPFKRLLHSTDHLNEGISCVVCHQYTGPSSQGYAGLSSFQDAIEPGNVYYGAFDDPVSNSYHRSAKGAVYENTDTICINCHNVVYDLNGDGQFQKGPDLILQQTSLEYDEYKALGGQETCVSCHMPIKQGKTSAADSAWLFFDKTTPGPDRVAHEHSFVGVDYPLDERVEDSHHEPKRVALLRGAGRLDVQNVTSNQTQVNFTASMTNTNTGHNLPTGFAFARQMWLEVLITDEQGQLVFQSGLIGDSAQDLCDAGTLDDPGNPLAQFVVGCRGSDPQLVNVQAKLVDKRAMAVDQNGNLLLDRRGEAVLTMAQGGRESVIQHLTAAAVQRFRPSTGQPMLPLPPNSTSSFNYTCQLSRPVQSATLSVRWLFRNLPPYFVRAIAAGQPKDEEPQVAPMVNNIRVVEMAKVVVRAR